MPIGAVLAALSLAKTGVDLIKGAKGAKNLVDTVGGGSDSGAGGGAMGMPQANPVLGGIGAVKSIAGAIKQKKADAMIPAMENPEERALASYATRRKRAFQTGTAQSAQRNALRENMKTGVNNSFKVGGGNKGLNMMTKLFNQGQLGLSEKALAGESQFAQMESVQKNKMSQRKLELGLLKYNTEQARAANLKKEGKATTNLALARTLNIGDTNPYGTAGNQGTSTSTTGSTTGVAVDYE